jgi:DNA-binding transcriptional LysR family regulator
MRMNRLDDFLSILEAGSIRAAARRNGSSQPALTKSLRQFEAELGVKLFQRTPTGVLPTRFGRSLAVRARAVRAELRKAREEMEEMAGGSSGTVSFGVGTVSAVLLVPNTVRRLREAYPEARIRITEGLPHILVPMVREERLDFALGARLVGPISPGLVFKPLYDSPRTVVVRRGHPLAKATSLADLQACEWLSLPALNAGVLRGWTKWLKGNRQLVECESYNSAAALLASTDMVGLISKRFMSQAFMEQNLVEVPVREPLPSFSVGLYRRADTPLTRIAATAADALMAAARGLAAPVRATAPL